MLLRSIVTALVTIVINAAVATVNASEFNVSGGISQGFPGNSTVLDEYERAAAFQAGGGVSYDLFGDGNASIHAQADSLADMGGLRAHSFASISKLSDQFIFGGQIFATSFARAVFTDFFIEGDGASTVTVPVNFFFSGEQSVGASAALGGGINQADSSVQVFFRFTSNSMSQQTGGGFHTIQTRNGELQPPFEDGILTGFNGEETLTLPAIVLPVGSFFTVELQLSTFTRLIYDSTEPTFTSGANAAFDHTLRFADGPVFGLPEGFTVSSVSAGIVDNHFAPVPLPAAFWLFAPAIAGLGVQRRKAA